MTTTFLQSEVKDPYKIYEKMLTDHPVYWDEKNQLWAIYSYEGCKAILNNSFAHIPQTNPDNKDGLNEYALLVTQHLARLTNGLQHDIAKQTAMLLFEKSRVVAISDILKKLLLNPGIEIDWVRVCKRLPVEVVLKSFDFNEEDSDAISGKIELLVKIMLPAKTPEEIKAINEISKQIYSVVEKHFSSSVLLKDVIKTLSQKYNMTTDSIFPFAVSNLIGIFIQSYDAGRGLLSNSLLQILNQPDLFSYDFKNKQFLEKSVVETLRFDPPVHNTKRVAAHDIVLSDTLINKGDLIFLVLAAANRDPDKFNEPDLFNINRPNNNEHLTFGSGGHMCLARHFSSWLALEALSCLFEDHPSVLLLNEPINYEPLINVRLPKHILISLS